MTRDAAPVRGVKVAVVASVEDGSRVRSLT